MGQRIMNKAMDKAGISINLPITRAWLCDMLENKETEVEVNQGKIELDFGAFEIKTLRAAF